MQPKQTAPWYGPIGLVGAVCVCAWAPAMACAVAGAQPQPTAGADGDEQGKLEAVVLEVHGNVKRAPLGVSPADRAGWKRVKVDDRLPSGTQIKTGPVRSDVILRFGDDTVIQVRKMTLASIDDFYRDQSGQTVRLDLGYGAVRGGSVESEIRSDLIIDSTVATLAKRGTDGLGIEVEPSTRFFEARLTRSGLLTLLSALSDRSREIRPGEYVNRDNIDAMPIYQKLLDLEVRFYPSESTTEGEASFTSRNSTGAAVLSPASGTEAAASSGRNDSNFVNGVIAQTNPPPATFLPPPPPFVNRAEGDFGVRNTFGGLFGNLRPRLGASVRSLPRRPVAPIARPRPFTLPRVARTHKARAPQRR